MKDLQLSLFSTSGLPVFEEIYTIFPENESSDLEYKSAKHGFPQSFWETYSSQDLCKEGYLISENKGRWTSYRLNMITKVDTSESKVDTSELKVDTSESKVDTSELKVDTSGQEMKVLEAKTVGKKKKMPKNELHKLIETYCDDYKSLEDIATAIKREPSYIQNKILPEMVREGKLEKKYPHTPNHPGQAYKTTDK